MSDPTLTTLPRCVRTLYGAGADGSEFTSCPNTATRGSFGPALCAVHGGSLPLAPGVTEDDEREAIACDARIDALVGDDAPRV